MKSLSPAMKAPFQNDLVTFMATHGFREVALPASSLTEIVLLLKRQTWNTNRAIVVVNFASVPADFDRVLPGIRDEVARLCGYIPFFWGIGIQVIAVGPGFASSGINPKKHVALVDNQWAIIQSIFLVDSSSQSYLSGRTWGQVVTGKFQDAIDAVLSRYFQQADGQ
jgi:hypothetical protein